MIVTQRELDQTFKEHSVHYGGVKEDYFAVLYLMREYGYQSVEEVACQVAFGGDDYGFDAFHLDMTRRNLYLFQFKWSENHTLFRESFRRLISAGIQRIFGDPLQDERQNPLVGQLKSAIIENKAIVDRVIVQFVFNGDARAAENSPTLTALREELEDKRHVVNGFFGREVEFFTQFASNQTKKKWTPPVQKLHRYDVDMPWHGECVGPAGERLHVGTVRLMDLYRMYREMGFRFFERNIRAGLSPESRPNRALRAAFRDIVLAERDEPSVFAFNHNGVALAVEALEVADRRATIVEPRLLNGAQTITSLAKFVDDNKDNAALVSNRSRLEDVHVIAKFISAASRDFVVNVTVRNNQQNPVEPWHLRANDDIQLAIQEKLRDDLRLFYERQEESFESLSDSELEDQGYDVTVGRAVDIKKLAQTFLAIQGQTDRMSRLRDVFGEEKQYSDCFRKCYLEADSRKIILLYKVQLKLNSVVQEIVKRGENKYDYMGRARNLIWALVVQGVLNADDLDDLTNSYGNDLVVRGNYLDRLKQVASTRVRFIVAEAVNNNDDQTRLAQESYSFLRTNAMFDRCMNVARRRFQWEKLPL
ncbi:MAG TPA: AIPR family protein [bacterium]|nr:AIPR family protein [bacterium]